MKNKDMCGNCVFYELKGREEERLIVLKKLEKTKKYIKGKHAKNGHEVIEFASQIDLLDFLIKEFLEEESEKT